MGDKSAQTGFFSFEIPSLPTFKKVLRQHRAWAIFLSAAYFFITLSLIVIAGFAQPRIAPLTTTLSSQTSSLNLAVASGGDDVVEAGTTVGSSFPVFEAGVQSKVVHNSAARFTNITIPQGATITTAYLTLNARLAGSSTPVKTKILAETTDNATPIVNYSDFNARPLTGGTSWEITQPWAAGSDYPSPNIASEIQAVIGRPGWQSGNALNIFWKNDGSADNYFRQAQSFNGSTSTPPRLYIEYTYTVMTVETAPTPIPTPTPAPTPAVIPSGGGFNLVADVSSEETALGMVEYGNDLYIATHTNPKNDGPGTIVRYNDSTGTYGVAYNIPAGQGLGDTRVLNNKIYVTSIDFGTNEAIFTYDGSTWQIVRFSASGLFDIEYYNNRYYVAGYTNSATLYSSPDGSTNWTQVYTQPYVGDPSIQYISRFTQIAIFNGKMFFTPQISNDPTTFSMPGRPTTSMYFPYEIFSFDGATYTPIEFSSEVMTVTDMEVFNNALYLSVWSSSTNVTGMWRTSDGVNFSPVSFFGPSATKTPKLSELVIYNNKLYVAEFATSQVILYASSDGANWTQEFSIPATQSVYSAGSWHNHTALGVYNGRLYAVPPAEGKLYVLGTSPVPIPTSTPTSSPTPLVTLPPAAATINVEAGRITEPLGDIFGTELREVYFSPKNPLRGSWNTRYGGQTIDRMLELAPVNGQKINIRGIDNPLGTSDSDNSRGGSGDGGHWRQLNNSYPNWFDPLPWGSNVDEYQEFVQRVNGQSQAKVNVGSAVAKEAAGLVSYLNGTDSSDPDVQLRIAHGFPQPYNATIFEIGNENYGSWMTGYNSTGNYSYANPNALPNLSWPSGGGDPPWWNRPTSDITNWAQRVVEYARAMRAKSPIPITIYAVANDWGLGYWSEYFSGKNPIKTIVSLAGDDIDGLILHFYPNNSWWGEDALSLLGRVEAYPTTRTGVESFSQSIDIVRNWASQQRAAEGKPAKDYKIAVTEYNFRSSTGGYEALGNSLTNGLFVADTLRMYANKGVDLANYFAIRMYEGSTSSFSFLHNGDVNRPTPMFYAMKIFTKHSGTQVLNTSVTGGNIITAPGGNRGSFQYNSLTSTASLSSDGKTLYLIVINKDLINAQTADVRLNGFTYQSARVWELNGPTPQSTNEVADTVKITDLGSVTLSAYTFPAHSVTALEFSGTGEAPIFAPLLTSGPTPTLSPTPVGGVGGVVEEVTPPQVTPITTEPEVLTPTPVATTSGTVEMELQAPSTVESGEPFQTTVSLTSPVSGTYNVTVAETKQEVSLKANEEKSVTVTVRAPEAQGNYTLTAGIDGTTKTQDVALDYSPLFLYVTETKTAGGTLIDVTVKNYEPLHTEFKIIKDGRDVFLKLIEGQKEYQQKLKLTQAGHYKVLAAASSQGKIVDSDEYLLVVAGKKEVNFGQLFVIMLFLLTLTVAILRFLYWSQPGEIEQT